MVRSPREGTQGRKAGGVPVLECRCVQTPCPPEDGKVGNVGRSSFAVQPSQRSADGRLQRLTFVPPSAGGWMFQIQV